MIYIQTIHPVEETTSIRIEILSQTMPKKGPLHNRTASFPLICHPSAIEILLCVTDAAVMLGISLVM